MFRVAIIDMVKFYIKRKKTIFSDFSKVVFIIILIFLIILTVIFSSQLTGCLISKVKNVTIEAGTAVPSAEAFFINAKTTGKFITDVSNIDTKKIGQIQIELESDGKNFTSFLIIEDTIPPKGRPAEQFIFKGNEIEAQDLVTDIDDVTNVTCSFSDVIPDVNKSGWQDATVILVDEGGNTASVDSSVYVFDVMDELIIEAGTVKKIAAQDFILNYTEVSDFTDLTGDLSFLSLEFSESLKSLESLKTENDGVKFSDIGSYSVTLRSGKYSALSVVKVQDTIPPTGKPVEQYIFRGNEIEPQDLVTDVDDVTNVTCSFDVVPDANKPGWQDATVILTDEGGNTANVDSKLYVFDVTDELIIEAGTVKKIAARDFIRNYAEADKANQSNKSNTANPPPLSLEPENGSVKFSDIGSYPVTLRSGKYSAPSVVKVVDTTPPTGKPAEQYIFRGNKIKPEYFVTDIKDATQVACSFDSTPDINKSGWQDVTVTLTDRGGNTANIKSRLYVFDVIDELVIEAGTVRSLSAKNFIRNYLQMQSENLSIIQNGEMKLSVPGTYSVTLKSGKYSAPSVVKVQDTTPPSASIKNYRTYKDKPIPAANFVYNISDVSAVTVRYKNLPDFSVEGVQTVYIVLEDAYKNASEYKAELTVVVDRTPPVISGALDRWVIVGGSVAYRSGITVADDFDPNPSLSIDSNGVNLNSPGTYTVIYSSKDESGNETEVKGTVTVRPIDMALVNEMADNILSQIINNNMSQYDKAYAIYKWVCNKMRYAANGNPREIAQRAYDCFTKGSGDCYTYMAASNVLLTRAGIKNVIIQRYSGAATPHYWNLVNIGTGWHHFDACPTPGNAVNVSQRFMFTESQAREYTEAINTSYRYYEYDKSAVPEVVE